MTSAIYKTQAKRLAEHLSRVHGVKIKSASMLEAVASLHGRSDWNTLLACGSVDAPSPNPILESLNFLAHDASSSPAAAPSLHESWIYQAVKANASSMSIQPTSTGCTVSIRVNGRRRPLLAANRDDYEKVRVGLSLAAGLEESDKSQTAVFGGEREFEGYRFSLQTSKWSQGAPTDIYLALQWRQASVQYPDLVSLGLSSLKEWRHGISQTSGLCLVTGLTNSGKTTTVASTAKALVSEGRMVHVLTSQISESGLPGASFERGVREPGDVVIMGELRDTQDLDQAFAFAAYGLLVIAEVHGRDTQGALQRLRSLDASESKLDTLLNVVMAQHLVARLCNVCRTGEGAACAKGCDLCYEGYQGVVPLSEAIAAYPGRKLTAFHKEKGGWDWALRAAAVAAVRDKLTSCEELARVFGPDAREWLNTAH